MPETAIGTFLAEISRQPPGVLWRLCGRCPSRLANLTSRHDARVLLSHPLSVTPRQRRVLASSSLRGRLVRMQAESSIALLPPAAANRHASVAQRTLRKLDRRFLTLCVGVIIIAYMDRSNLGYAANDLCNDLEMSHSEYGLGVSLFYAGYLTTQVVGNVILSRLGAPLWIAIIMFAWGCAAASSAAIQNVAQYFTLRVLLGVAEGGTFPALFYTVTAFYPPDHVGAVHGIIVSSGALAMPISAPISAGLVTLGPRIGIDGWRLLFLVEGLFPVFYAVVFYVLLPASPEKAQFLTREEKDWIAESRGSDQALPSPFAEEVRSVLSCWTWVKTTTAAAVGFGVNAVLMFWATLMIHEALYGEDDDDDGGETCGTEHGNSALPILITAVPYLMVSLICIALKRTAIRNRPLFCAIGNAVAGGALIVFMGARKASAALGVLVLCCAIVVCYVTFSYEMSLALAFLSPSNRRTGSAMTNVCASIGAFTIPLVNGVLIDVLGEPAAIAIAGGLVLMAAALCSRVEDPAVIKGRALIAQTNSSGCP